MNDILEIYSNRRLEKRIQVKRLVPTERPTVHPILPLTTSGVENRISENELRREKSFNGMGTRCDMDTRTQVT